MVTEISAAVASTKAIADIFNGIVGIGVDTKINDAVIEVQNITPPSNVRKHGARSQKSILS